MMARQFTAADIRGLLVQLDDELQRRAAAAR